MRTIDLNDMSSYQLGEVILQHVKELTDEEYGTLFRIVMYLEFHPTPILTPGEFYFLRDLVKFYVVKRKGPPS